MTKRELYKRMDELIMDDGYTSYDKLPDENQDELIALSIRAMGRDAWEVICEADDMKGVIDDLITYLLNGTVEFAERLADTMRSNARVYFKGLPELYDERYSELECERKHEAGLHPVVDHVNGETRWIR